MGMRIIKKLITPTIMMGWALYYFIEVSGKTDTAGMFIKPVFWIMACLYVLIVWMDIRDLRDEKKKESKATLDEASQEKRARTEKNTNKDNDLKRTAICIGSGLIYVFLLPYLGFIISTSLILAVLFCWLKAPNKAAAFALAILVALCMYALFDIGLNVPLPTGFLGVI